LARDVPRGKAEITNWGCRARRTKKRSDLAVIVEGYQIDWHGGRSGEERGKAGNTQEGNISKSGAYRQVRSSRVQLKAPRTRGEGGFLPPIGGQRPAALAMKTAAWDSQGADRRRVINQPSGDKMGEKISWVWRGKETTERGRNIPIRLKKCWAGFQNTPNLEMQDGRGR